MMSDGVDRRISLVVMPIARRGRPAAGAWRRRRPRLEALESRRLLSVNIAEFPIRTQGGFPQGIATGAGSDKDLWFTLSSNNIGMINPADTKAGVVQYPIPTYNSGPGPITAGPDGSYWFFEEAADQFGVSDPTTGRISEIPLLGAAKPGVAGMTAGPDGAVWFTESGTSQVGEIRTSTHQVTLFPTITPGAEPYGIVEGPDGNIWFSEAGANKVGTINPTTHVMQEFLIDSTGNDQAEGLTVGPDHNLWIALAGASKIGVMNPATGAMIAEYSTPTADRQPDSIVTGPDGNLWFTEAQGTSSPLGGGIGYIGSVTTKGIVQEYRTNSPSGLTGIAAASDEELWFVGPGARGIEAINTTSDAISSFSYTSTTAGAATGVAADANGQIWFTQQRDDQVGVLDPTTGITTEFPLPNSSSGGPLGIALGADGGLWFTEPGSNFFGGATGDQIGTIVPSNDRISQYTVQTANSNPSGIVSDPADGNLWFTEESANQVGRINPTTHAIAEYAVPTRDSAPEAIAVDKDGNVWFAESNAARIGELSPNNPNQINEYNIPGKPYGIAAGPDGNIWFTEAVGVIYTFKIGVFSPSSDTVIAQYPVPDGVSAGAITAGSDGHLWFVEGAGKIGMVTTAGVITGYAVTNAQPVAITSGPDGNIWFTGTGTSNSGTGSYDPNVVGVVTLTAAATPTQLAVATQPPGSVTSGKGFGLVVSVEDAAGNPDLDYTGSVTIALAADPGNDTLKGPLTAPVVDGVAIFSGLTLENTGTGYTIQATASGLKSATTSPFNVTLGATKLLVTTQPPASVGAGTSFGLVVSAEDGQGNVDTSYNGPITLTLGNHPNGGTLSGVLTIGANDGVATFTGLSLNVPFNDYTILASSGSLTSATTIGFDVTAGPATRLAIPTTGEPPSSILAGGLFDVTVVAEDQYGDPATGFNGAVTLALTTGGGVTLQGKTTGNAQGGQITFTGLSIDTMGGYQIQATTTSSGVTSATTSFINVTAGAATQLVVDPNNSPPASIAAGANFGFKVDAEDAYGNLDTTFNSTVAIALVNAAGAILHGAPTATAQGGVASFSSLAITTAGTYTIRASSGSLTPGKTNPITVTAGAVSGLMVTQQPPGTIAAGGPFGLAVEGVDQYGNPITSFGGAVTVALVNSPGATLNGTLTQPAQNGVVTFSGLSINKAGTYTIQASSGTLTKATTNGINVTAAAASQLVILTPPSSSATAGKAFPTQPVIAIEDADGNIETGDNSTQVAVSLASGSGPLLGTKTVTVKAGIATFTDLYQKKAETIALKFSGGGLGAGPSNDIVISPDVAGQLVIHAQPPSTASAGVAFSPPPVIYEEDQYGNIETGDDTTVITATLKAGAGPLQGATATVSGGVATFTGLADATMETVTLDFTGGGLTSATSDPVVVGPGAPDHLVITTQPYVSVVAGNPLTDPIVVEERDKYENPVTTDNSTVVAASLATGGGTLKGTTTATMKGGVASFDNLEDDKAGTLTLRFSAGTLPPVISNPSSVSPAAASALGIVRRPPGGIVAGEQFAVTVDAFDPYGNVATSFNGPMTVALASGSGGTLSGTLTVTAGAGEAQFTDLVSTQSGSISLTATNDDLTPAPPTDPIPVSPDVASKLVVHAQPSSAATAGLPFSAQPVIYIEDAYGNLEAADDGTVVTASPSGSGPLQGTTTATARGGVATFNDLAEDVAGSFTIQFTGGGLIPASSNAITVSAAAATQLVVTTPPPSSLSAGQPFTIVVSAEDPYGNVVTSFSGEVTISLPGHPDFETVTASDGAATFSGLALDAAASGGSIRATSPGLASQVTPVSIVSHPTPTITDEHVLMSRKTDKKGKPVGRAVLQGFVLDFSTAMNPATAGSAANYTVAALPIRRGRKKSAPTLIPVAGFDRRLM